MKTTTKKIAVIGSIILAATLESCSPVKQAPSPKYHGPYDASKIGADALNKEEVVVKVNINYNPTKYSEFVWGMCYRGGLLRPGHTYYFRGMPFEDYSNKDLAEIVLGKNLTLKVLPKEKSESGIFPVPEGVNPAYIPTKTSKGSMPLEELVWQPEAKIEYVGQNFWVKTTERNTPKYYGIEIMGYRIGDVSVGKSELSPEVVIITKGDRGPEVTKVK